MNNFAGVLQFCGTRLRCVCVCVCASVCVLVFSAALLCPAPAWADVSYALQDGNRNSLIGADGSIDVNSLLNGYFYVSFDIWDTDAVSNGYSLRIVDDETGEELVSTYVMQGTLSSSNLKLITTQGGKVFKPDHTYTMTFEWRTESSGGGNGYNNSTLYQMNIFKISGGNNGTNNSDNSSDPTIETPEPDDSLTDDSAGVTNSGDYSHNSGLDSSQSEASTADDASSSSSHTGDVNWAGSSTIDPDGESSLLNNSVAYKTSTNNDSKISDMFSNSDKDTDEGDSEDSTTANAGSNLSSATINAQQLVSLGSVYSMSSSLAGEGDVQDDSADATEDITLTGIPWMWLFWRVLIVGAFVAAIVLGIVRYLRQRGAVGAIPSRLII